MNNCSRAPVYPFKKADTCNRIAISTFRYATFCWRVPLIRRARLVVKENPETSYPLEDRDYIIGRSDECDIQIPDGFVSRRQAKLFFEDGNYVLLNTGSNPIFVNDSRVTRQILRDNDRITVGKTDLIFQLKEPSLAAAEAAPSPPADVVEDKTVLIQPARQKEEGPRLVIVSPEGNARIYPLKTRRLLIGRSPDVDLRLDDLSVSRRHCAIEKDREGFLLKSLTYTNPVIFDDHPVNEKPLISGDHFRIGTYSVTFLSDRPEHLPMKGGKVVLKKGNTGILIGGLIGGLIVLAAGYGLYRWISSPREVTEKVMSVDKMKLAEDQIQGGDFDSARTTLAAILQEKLTPLELQKVNELFSQVVLFEAQKMAGAGYVKEARNHLTDFLAKHGGGIQTRTFQEQLDSYRLQFAQQMEDAGDHLGALREFSTIAEDSLVYDQAQHALSRIWLSSQQKEVQSLPISQLLEQADEHFQARRYTTPVNNNAYVIYQLILTVDPQNSIAKERIEQMKGFYIEHGERYFQQRNYSAALSYFQRYTLIDPDNPEIKKRIAESKKAVRKEVVPQRPRTSGAEDRQDETVRDLLEGSQTDSP